MEPTYKSNPPMIFEDSSFDIKRYVSLFLSNWYWFAIAFFITISIAYGMNRAIAKRVITRSTAPEAPRR